MKAAEYWNHRAEINARAEHLKADVYTSQLLKEYRKSVMTITKDIDAFYGRFAKDNTVTMMEARKLLTKGELKEFKMTLQEFTAKAKNNTDGRWTTELNNVYYRTRISRYEALLIQIRQEIEMITGRQQTDFKALLTGNYTDSYYRTIFDVQKGTNIGMTFAKVDTAAVDRVLMTDWAGSNFSKRIWSNQDALWREVQTKLTQSFIRGDSPQKTIQYLQDRFDVSRSNAARLVRTESAHISGQATFDGYVASGVVQQYQFLATLDSRTSTVCQGMDNLVFSLSEKEVGVNYPPLHANCRSTTVAYFGDEEPGERIARGKDGKTYYVPDSMNYKEWYEKHVMSGETIEIGKSLGAASFKDKVSVPEGGQSYLKEGSKITKMVTFAGKGTDKPVKVAKYLSEQFSGDEKGWQKVRGQGTIEYNGNDREAELHWFQHDDVGRVKMKVKRWFE